MSKLLIAEYTTAEYYKIPADWDIEDINIKWGELYYKGEKKVVPQCEAFCDTKRPANIEIDEEADVDLYFDCEEEEQEE